MLKGMRNLLKQQSQPGRPGGGQHAGDFFPSRLAHDGEAGENWTEAAFPAQGGVAEAEKWNIFRRADFCVQNFPDDKKSA